MVKICYHNDQMENCMNKKGLALLLLFGALPSMAQESVAAAAADSVKSQPEVVSAQPEAGFVASDAAVAPAEPVAATVDSSAAPVEPVAATVDSSVAPAEPAAVPVDSVTESAVKALAAAPKDSAVADTVKKEPAVAVTADSASTPVETASPASIVKRLILGVSGAVTYNNLYDSKLGLANLDDGAEGYTVKTTGQDDLMGNYWGIGANLGLGMLYMFTDMFGVHAELDAAYRAGSGESDVTVTLTWDDEDKPRERASLGIEYSLKQVNLDIPVLFRVALPNVLYVEMGPMLSFCFYSHEKSVVTDDDTKNVYRGDNVCDFVEFDMAFGLGAMRRIGTKSIEAGLRFVMGMTRLSDADDAPKTWQGQFNMTFWFL